MCLSARAAPYEFVGKQTVFVVDDVDHVTMLLASEY